jgi:hypothetical protein
VNRSVSAEATSTTVWQEGLEVGQAGMGFRAAGVERAPEIAWVLVGAGGGAALVEPTMGWAMAQHKASQSSSLGAGTTTTTNARQERA